MLQSVRLVLLFLDKLVMKVIKRQNASVAYALGERIDRNLR